MPVLGSLSPARRRVVLLAVALVAALVVGLGGVVLLRAYDEVDAAPQGDLGPVVLVAGYGGDVEALDPLRDLLTDEGREVSVLDPVGDGTGDLGVQAEALGDLVDGLIADGAPSVDVVGYSAGGVVARSWVRDHGGDEQARRVVTLGSPHHGTGTAQLALDALGTCPQACVQLAPDSDFLRALDAGDETPAGPEWVSLWSDSDRVVTPPSSARLDGATNLTVQSFCPGATTSHGELPGDPATRAVVSAALGTGDVAGLADLDVAC